MANSSRLLWHRSNSLKSSFVWSTEQRSCQQWVMQPPSFRLNKREKEKIDGSISARTTVRRWCWVKGSIPWKWWLHQRKSGVSTVHPKIFLLTLQRLCLPSNSLTPSTYFLNIQNYTRETPLWRKRLRKDNREGGLQIHKEPVSRRKIRLQRVRIGVMGRHLGTGWRWRSPGFELQSTCLLATLL